MTEYVEKTQKELGAVLSAPKLTDKLLSRPPFRYLHDIVKGFLDANAFPAGLYTDDQLDHTKVTEKDAKIEFLQLLVDVVEAATGKKSDAKPAKIVAGQEPENTNKLLQLLAVCAGLSADAKAAAVAKVKGGAAPAKPAGDADADAKKKEEERARRKEKERKEKEEKEKKEKEEKEKAKKEEKKDEKKEEKKDDKKKETEEERARRKEKERKEKEEKEKKDDKKKETEEERARRKEKERKEKEEKEKKDDKKDKEKEKKSETEEERRQRHEEERRKRHEEKKREKEKEEDVHSPSTAGRAPPRTKPTHEVMAAQGTVDSKPSANVIAEAPRGADKGEDGAAQDDWMKVAEQFDSRPTGGATAAVAEDVEVKGILGQQALKAKKEQEEAARLAQEAASAPRDGGIVIRGSKSGQRGAGGAAGSVMVDSELNKLREQLQLLTKASNPLGKFLEAIHDDIDSMSRELETWRSEARSQALAASDARRQTEESLQEIQAQLQNLEDAISDQMLKTNNLRRNILANDKAVEGMVQMVVGPDAGRE